MCNNCDYTIHGRHHHFGWDNSIAPVERVAPGSTIEFQCLDSSGGQLTENSTLTDVGRLDFGKVNPVTGPIFVEGAEPGDALKVTIEAFKPSGFGWTANIPGFGLLADQFKEPGLTLWKYDAGSLEPANADKEKELCSRFNIMALPYIMLIKPGKVPVIEVGDQPARIMAIIEEQLLK